jgi:hypothetical protein
MQGTWDEVAKKSVGFVSLRERAVWLRVDFMVIFLTQKHSMKILAPSEQAYALCLCAIGTHSRWELRICRNK